MPEGDYHPDLNSINQSFIDKYEGIVISLAGEYSGGSDKRKDLIQQGFLGLLEANQKFEPSREVRFSTNAHYYVRGRILDFLKFERRKGMSFVSNDEVSYVSLESEILFPEADNVELSQGNALTDGFSEEELIYPIDLSSLKKKVDFAMRFLTSRQREVIHLIFWEELSISKVAIKLNVSVPRVAKLLKVSLKKLRRQLILREVLAL